MQERVGRERREHEGDTCAHGPHDGERGARARRGREGATLLHTMGSGNASRAFGPLSHLAPVQKMGTKDSAPGRARRASTDRAGSATTTPALDFGFPLFSIRTLLVAKQINFCGALALISATSLLGVRRALHTHNEPTCRGRAMDGNWLSRACVATRIPYAHVQ